MLEIFCFGFPLSKKSCLIFFIIFIYNFLVASIIAILASLIENIDCFSLPNKTKRSSLIYSYYQNKGVIIYTHFLTKLMHLQNFIIYNFTSHVTRKK